MNRNLVVSTIIVVCLAGCGISTRSRGVEPGDGILQFETGFPLLAFKGVLLGETTTLEDRMEYYHVPGVSIAVISDYEIEWAKGYGVQDAEGGEPVTVETLFPPASMGKTLTAVAALRCVETGLIDLDQDVNELLVSWKIPENEFTAREDVTLRRLLSHTAGMSVGGFTRLYLQGEEMPSLVQILDGETPTNNPPVRVDMLPGAQWRYSGGGYQVVEQLLVDVTGKSFPEIMQDSILDPLGMTSTFYAVELPAELKPVTASAHGRWGLPIPGKWLNAPYMGAGAAWTTPTDLAKFANEMMLSIAGRSNLVLSPAMAQEMITPQAEGIPLMGPVSMDWGLGWQLNELGGEIFVSHGGDIPEGYQNLLVIIPARGWGVVIMTNGAGGDALRMEILYALAVQYGVLPSLSRIAWLGYLLLVLLSALAAWAITILVRRVRLRRSIDAGSRKGIKSRRALVPVVITVVVASILYFTVLAVGLGVIFGRQQVGELQREALGTIERGDLLAEHGMIEEALASFSEAQQLVPGLQIPASSLNHVCIRGAVWGYHTEVMDACEMAVSLAPNDDGMLFGRGLARALTGDMHGAIDDFEVYVEWTKDNGIYDPYGIEVEGFILELKAGRNPFDEAQLDAWK